MHDPTRRPQFSNLEAFGLPEARPPAQGEPGEQYPGASSSAGGGNLAGSEPLLASPGRASGVGPAGAVGASTAGVGVPAAHPEVQGSDSWVPAPNVVREQTRMSSRSVAQGLAVAAGIFLLALLPRLVFLYLVTDPEVLIPSWSNDTWHRWQIAYLSKEVGFSQGFLRLWDLKGLEYYWGVLHPVLLTGLFALTGSVDIMILRWLTMVAGALNILLIYLLGRRFWNPQVGLAAAFLAALNPLVIFNDPSGMVEPLGFAFLLAGIYFYPRRPALAGLMWALAAMSRAEAWLLSAGLLVAAMLGKEPSHRKVALGLGWGLPLVFYMKYLTDWTGNPIYPIYWNFLANAIGRWEFRETFTDYQLAARPVLGTVFVIAALGALWALRKRPRAYLLYLLGFGTTAFVSGFMGLTAYLKSYEPWFWMTRFFVFSYVFAGLLVAIVCLGWLPSRARWWGKLGLGWSAVLGVWLALQLTWPPVLYDIQGRYTSRTSVRGLRDQGEFVAQVYQGGTVLIPEGFPQFTYALARYGGIEAEDILGQMYGPTYYYQGEDPLQDWEIVGPQMWDWFEKANVTLLVMAPDDERFLRMIEERPERFVHVGSLPHSGLQAYRVEAWW